MRTYLDCYSCLVRQAVEAGRRATHDPVLHEGILREVLGTLAQADLSLPPPIHARLTGAIVQRHTGVGDAYLADKRRSNELALGLAARYRPLLAAAPDPFALAIRLAAAGNIIDFGVHGELDLAVVAATVEHALTAPLDQGTLDRLREQAANARRILYLADNAGELAFDRLFIEQLPPHSVTVVVKGGPALNDALREDAAAVGIDEVATVIDNGTRIPGTWLPETSPAFHELFAAADLVIAKGQGNFETLNEVPREIFFLLKVKCAMVSAHVGEPIGTLLLTTGR